MNTHFGRKTKGKQMKNKIAIIGYGYVGKAYHKVFPDAVIYDESDEVLSQNMILGPKDDIKFRINQECKMAIVCVPTNPTEDGSLDMSAVHEVVSWLDTPLILIKSALMPGTVDSLVEASGKKIAVSVEYVGMGKYFIPDKYPNPEDPRQHPMILVGGEEKTATACAEILWEKVSPTVRIHILSALEAEISKLVENTYPALKVTFINCLMSLAKNSGANFIKLQQAWTADPRVDGMHLRTLSYKRGWKSHCWDKDVPALLTYAESVGAQDMAELIKTIININAVHLNQNELQG